MSRLLKALRLSMMLFVIWDSVALSSSCSVHGKVKKISGVSWTVWDAVTHQVCLKNHRTREGCGLSGVITSSSGRTWKTATHNADECFQGTVILLCSGQFKVQTLKKKRKEDKEQEETKDNQERTRRSTRQEEGPKTNTNNKKKMRMRRSKRQGRITRKGEQQGEGREEIQKEPIH